jgi:large subunit ribosomal protein L21
MFAVVETGGKQYHVKGGDVIKVEKIAGEVGEVIELAEVLAVDGKFGAPHVKGAKVAAEVLEHRKNEKVVVFKKKRRQNYRRKRGHRQQISVLRVKEIIS